MKRHVRLVRCAIGIVFLSAATYRLINASAGFDELSRLRLPSFFYFLIIAVEITVGTAFIINKLVKYAALLSILFLVGAIGWGLIVNGSYVLSNIGELFVFDANPTDIFLHAIYIAVLLYIFRSSE